MPTTTAWRSCTSTRAPRPGSTLEKRAIRQVGLVFTLAGVFAFLFVVVYVGSGWFLPDWHWQITENGWSAFFTPMLGLCMGLAMGLVGIGLVLFTKKLLPHETAVQDKHDGSHFDRVTAGATLVGGFHNSGLARRKLITRSLGFMGAGLGLMLIMPIGGLIKNPNKGNPLGTTEWAKGVRLRPQRRHPDPPRRPAARLPGDRLPGGRPAATGSPTPRRCSSGCAPSRSLELQPPPGPGRGSATASTWPTRRSARTPAARSRCTSRRPAGSSARATSRSSIVTQGAKPVFGPATRPLPQLPIEVDDEGYFVAASDYIEAVGPTYWNRERDLMAARTAAGTAAPRPPRWARPPTSSTTA